MDSLFYWTGSLAWVIVGAILVSAAIKVLWDGFRALTVVLWGSRICKKKTGSYFFKGIVRAFFHNWGTLLGTKSGAITLHGEGGYWEEWNDWKVYGEAEDENEPK